VVGLEGWLATFLAAWMVWTMATCCTYMLVAFLLGRRPETFGFASLAALFVGLGSFAFAIVVLA
jgi:hypothetical protein